MAESLPSLTNAYLMPGMLLPTIRERCERALAAGALEPLATTTRVVPDGEFSFVVRVLSSLRKKNSEPRQSAAVNPFLPHDPELFVTNLSDTHHALLNRFNVLDHHVLIVTRAFEPQQRLLNLADFDALAAFLIEYDGLGFYNGGVEAGASQPHKHLQYVTLPVAPEGDSIPIEPVLLESLEGASIQRSPHLPWEHRAVRLRLEQYEDSAALAAGLLSLYTRMAETLRIQVEGPDHARPYNLLVTRRWMLMLPRRREHAQGVSINALGFAGTLLVSDQAQLDALLQPGGPMSALRAVSFE